MKSTPHLWRPAHDPPYRWDPSQQNNLQPSGYVSETLWPHSSWIDPSNPSKTLWMNDWIVMALDHRNGGLQPARYTEKSTEKSTACTQQTKHPQSVQAVSVRYHVVCSRAKANRANRANQWTTLIQRETMRSTRPQLIAQHFFTTHDDSV